MTKQFIDISESDYNILKEITNKYATDFDFYVFGSRVQGKAKKYSDIDIAYEKKGNKSIALLRDELEESNLSITVDLVDMDEVDLDFLELIRSQMIPL